MRKPRIRTRSNKRSKREVSKGRLVMDAIYGSSKPEVENFYRQVVQEEDLMLSDHICSGKTWSVSEYLDRVHMRMGKRFFHLLPPIMQLRFQREYPLALIGAVDVNGVNGLSTAV